jgi:hypothetical protein
VIRFPAATFGFVMTAVTATAVLAQDRAVAERTETAPAWRPPRTSAGHPAMEGVWSFSTLTPLVRPPRFAGRAFMTLEEAEAFEREMLDRVNLDRRVADGALDLREGRDGAYNEFWVERGRIAMIGGQIPTSLLVDPPDGRLPPPARNREIREGRTFDGPADFSLSERCIRSAAGPPFVPGTPDGNFIRITQSRDHIAITQEKFHEVRIVSLDGRAHLSPEVRSWLGDSIGRWDGDTLVVDTTNFTDALSSSARFDGNLHLVERFTRAGPDTLLYEFTVNDPTTFTKPWTVRLPMTKTSQQMYENACHEGNYAMRNMLSAARAAERQ